MKTFAEIIYAQENALHTIIDKTEKGIKYVDQKRLGAKNWLLSLSDNKGWRKEIEILDKDLGSAVGQLAMGCLRSGSKKVTTIIQGYMSGKLSKEEVVHELQEEKTFLQKNGLWVGAVGATGATTAGVIGYRHYQKKKREEDPANLVKWD